jgi:hypothetical protein
MWNHVFHLLTPMLLRVPPSAWYFLKMVAGNHVFHLLIPMLLRVPPSAWYFLKMVAEVSFELLVYVYQTS